LRKSSDKGPIPRRLRFGAPQESDFQRLGKNTTRFNPAGNRSSVLFREDSAMTPNCETGLRKQIPVEMRCLAIRCENGRL
jgi:hypothetical protein